MKPDVRTFDDADALCRAARDEFTARAARAIADHGTFSVALSGGSTPKRLYASLALVDRARLDWAHVHLFFGDERCVPPDDEESNYRMVRESLLSKIEIPSANVHRMRAELASVDEATHAYEHELRAHFGLAAGEIPRFDLVLLGLGPDGHTASLFPGTSAIAERERLVVAPWVPKFGTHRVTLTLPVIDNAACVLFLVAGEDKRAMLKSVLEGAPDVFPAQLVTPANGELLWFVDRSAAQDLSRAS
jgi:6-phosphogluconolactonase